MELYLQSCIRLNLPLPLYVSFPAILQGRAVPPFLWALQTLFPPRPHHFQPHSHSFSSLCLFSCPLTFQDSQLHGYLVLESIYYIIFFGGKIKLHFQQDSNDNKAKKVTTKILISKDEKVKLKNRLANTVRKISMNTQKDKKVLS